MKQEFEQFKARVYEQTKRLFPDGAIEVFLARAAGPGSEEPFNPAVRVVHKETGRSAECSDFPSQVENRVVATLQLRIACDSKSA